jgi:hypothetical protein
MNGGGWAEKAAALGCGPLDLFGCDGERPFARIDHAGLLWLLNGTRLSNWTTILQPLRGGPVRGRRSGAAPSWSETWCSYGSWLNDPGERCA